MMKKKNLIAAVSIASVVTVAATLAGCSQKNQIVVTGTETSAASGQTNGQGFARAMSNFKTPNLMGTITSIKNGKVTLKLMKVQTFGGTGSRPTGSRPAGGGQGAGSGQAPAGGGQGGGSMPSVSASSGFRRNFAEQYTGKTKTITLTGSTKIVSLSFRQSSSSSQTTLSLSSLQKGQTLYVYYKSDKKTINYVGVRTVENRGSWQNGSGGTSSDS